MLFVKLTCAEPEAERRMQNQSRAEFDKMRSLAVYRNARDSGEFVYPALPSDGPAIDTDMRIPLEVATEVVARLS